MKNGVGLKSGKYWGDEIRQVRERFVPELVYVSQWSIS